MQNQNTESHQPSVDEQIANEIHTMYQYEHQSTSKFSGLTQLIRYRPLAVSLAVVSVIVVIGSISALAVGSITPKQKAQLPDESLAEDKNVYGIDTDDSYYYDINSGVNVNDSSDPSSSNKTMTDSLGLESTDRDAQSASNDATSSRNTEISSRGTPRTKSTPRQSSPSTPKTGGSTPTPTPTSPSNKNTQPIAVATWNYKNSYPNSDFKTGLIALASVSDILSLQEIGAVSRQNALKDIIKTCQSCNFAAYIPSSKADKLPILWDKTKFQLLDGGYKQLVNGQSVEGGMTSPKFVTWVRLKDRKTSQAFYVLNTHFITQGEKKGYPNPDAPISVSLYKQQLSGVLTKAAAFKKLNPVFVNGDFNTDYRRDSVNRHPDLPYARFNSIDVWANWRYFGPPSGGTQNSERVIDYVYLSRNSQIKPSSTKKLSKYGSDHNAVVLNATIYY